MNFYFMFCLTELLTDRLNYMFCLLLNLTGNITKESPVWFYLTLVPSRVFGRCWHSSVYSAVSTYRFTTYFWQDKIIVKQIIAIFWRKSLFLTNSVSPRYAPTFQLVFPKVTLVLQLQQEILFRALVWFVQIRCKGITSKWF